MIGLLIQLLVFLLVAALVWWVIQQLGLPHPIQIIAIVVLVIIALVFIARSGLVVGEDFQFPKQGAVNQDG